MSGLKLTNNASALLASLISDVDTELALATGTGALFPTLAEGEWFPLVVVAPTGEREIMRATGRTGDLITVTREQEGTAARAFDPGARVDLRLTAATFAEFVADFAALIEAVFPIDLESDVTGIAPADNGGTGIAFLAFAGPETTVKTYTGPNANAVLMTNQAGEVNAFSEKTTLVGADLIPIEDSAALNVKKKAKRSTIVRQTVQSTASSSTPTPAPDGPNHQFNITAQAASGAFAAPTGTPSDGDVLKIRIKDNGTARATTWNAIYRAVLDTLPTTTIINQVGYLGFIYNAAETKWDLVARKGI